MGNHCGTCEPPAVAAVDDTVPLTLLPVRTLGAQPHVLCQSVWGSGCARAAAQWSPWEAPHAQSAAQQRELRRLREENARLGELLAAARAEAAQMRGAWGSDRGGSMSCENPSTVFSTPLHPAAAGSICPRLSTASFEREGSGAGRPPAPPESPSPRTPALLPGGACRAALFFSSPSPPAPVCSGSPTAPGGEPQGAEESLGVEQGGDIEFFPGVGGISAASLRAALLEQQLRAAKAELWGLPMLAGHCRAAVLGAERSERAALEAALHSAPRVAEPAAALGCAPARQGPGGILQLRDTDGQWLSKSQFRRRYGSNRRFTNMARRMQLSPSPATAENRVPSSELPPSVTPLQGQRQERRGSLTPPGCTVGGAVDSPRHREQQGDSVPTGGADAPAEATERPQSPASVAPQAAVGDRSTGGSDGGEQQRPEREHTAQFALHVHAIAHRVAHFVPGAFAPVSRGAALSVAEVSKMRSRVWFASFRWAVSIQNDALRMRGEAQELLDSVLRTISNIRGDRTRYGQFIRRIRMHQCILDMCEIEYYDAAKLSSDRGFQAMIAHVTLEEVLGQSQRGP
eukprot:TRINITY_DN18567_c0_g4_i1.p1 TRINITY_DN18567_c0_g4~~TRINITY_DN18567_c0_g4_i1.p1  ORF type:complete len:600 (+),score=96.30 TRINITY_DN18567_c0_g4_i1:84-1802(+)